MFAVNDFSQRVALLAVLSASLCAPVYAQSDAAQRAAEEAAAAAAAAIELSDEELAAVEADQDDAFDSAFAADDDSFSDEDSFTEENIGYSSDPVRLEVSFDYLGQMRMNYLTVRAKEDLVVLHDLVINRGNCKYTLSGRMDAPFPVNIAFGNGAKYLIQCSSVLEVTVRTNFGEHTYTFGR